ncbi:hypothetical protein A1359_03430 [Methylomonas lenta]|uniref:DUF4230 domain-containing protein n=1 Tax=Methylomonas lenta TaxID=980561 RepID=A0A177NQ20_9GAMM|nr:hypothetical protein [Methylomonas lenta]OAI20075.1 hypothetical protein A1359_03430 [Methylomonas lenta]
MLKMLINGIKTPLISILIFASAGLFIWFYLQVRLIDNKEVNTAVSQFLDLRGADEYIIAQLVSHESFTKEKYKYLLDLPIGDTSVSISLVAHYKYYIKLSELEYSVIGDNLVFHVPQLYLSTPVSFEFSTVNELCTTTLLGINCTEMLKQLKNEVSTELANKGKLKMSAVYDKAAKALADNFNNFNNSNKYSANYKNIVIVFDKEISQSQRQFNYNKSYCGKEACALELNLTDDWVFTIK